jgi:hypothetical protein
LFARRGNQFSKSATLTTGIPPGVKNPTDVLPVVSRANVHELLGVVRLHDVLESYGLNNRGES